MANGSAETADAGKPTAPRIVRRQITPDPTSAKYDFLAIVAELEGTEIEELPSLHDEVDHVVETLFKEPPSARSQFEIQFSYAGYRVTMDQRGFVKLVDAKATVE